MLRDFLEAVAGEPFAPHRLANTQTLSKPFPSSLAAETCRRNGNGSGKPSCNRSVLSTFSCSLQTPRNEKGQGGSRAADPGAGRTTEQAPAKAARSTPLQSRQRHCQLRAPGTGHLKAPGTRAQKSKAAVGRAGSQQQKGR